MEIKDIKNRLSILAVLHHYNLSPDKNNRLNCPFHKDKTPSLQLYPETNTWTCFSSNCRAGSGDVIDFIMKHDKTTKHQAILKAKALLGTASKATPLPAVPATTPPVDPDDPKEYLPRIATVKKVFTSFSLGIHTCNQAKEYVKKRNLDRTLLEIGYNSGKYHYKHRDNKQFMASLIKYGIVRQTKSGHIAFAKQCIIFPLKDKAGKIVSMYGRSVTDNDNARHYYFTTRQGLYPGYPDKETKQLILTESIIDAASLLQYQQITKQYTILSCYGTNGLTEEHTAAIKELKNLIEVIFFFDGDEAGRTAVQKHKEALQQLRPKTAISSVKTPDGEDVNSLLQGHNPEILTHLLDERVFLFSTDYAKASSVKTEKPSDEKKKEIKPEGNSQEPQPNTVLDTQNPYKLKYFTPTANYYIQGGLRNELENMKVTLVIEHKESKQKSRTKLDLYEDKQAEKISKEASEKLNLRTDQVQLDLGRLTDLLEAYRDKQLRSEEQQKPVITINTITTKKCYDFLRKPGLIKNLNKLIGKAGVVGEENNRIFLFGIAASYKMPDTLHALIQGSSGSGKTHLLIKISNLIPAEDCICLTRVTDSSFYNYGEYDLVNKLICMEDLDGMKEDAFLAFRELQSRGMLNSSTSVKDNNGQIRGFVKTVRGPIASMSATTKGEIYEDNMTRNFLIAVDESQEQTERIIDYQNNKAAGLINTKKEQQITTFIQNCLRLIKPYEVINPYANKVKLPQEAHKIRRLNELYQCYVRQITLLNQYQRKRDNLGRLISEREDLQTACDIMFESILLKIDELDGSLRHFYERLKQYIKDQGEKCENYLFTQREIRQELKMSKTQMQRYTYDLLDLEYIQLSSGFANRGYKYKIVYWDDITELKKRIKAYLNDQLDKLVTPGGPNGLGHQNGELPDKTVLATR
ncbi:MAG: toprim domain-containing protein [Flavobacteriales bacterium]|nr:toprim domain-containing protein [Flavobacteriales bacterium]